jgi:hypothetical protein
MLNMFRRGLAPTADHVKSAIIPRDSDWIGIFSGLEETLSRVCQAAHVNSVTGTQQLDDDGSA